MYKVIHRHEISMAHRLVDHPRGCGRLHGHNYLIEIEVLSYDLNDDGMVIDFGHIKSTCDEWLDSNWDHRLMLWDEDPLLKTEEVSNALALNGLVVVDGNPTAEYMASKLRMIFSDLLRRILTPPFSINVTVHETSTGRAFCC